MTNRTLIAALLGGAALISSPAAAHAATVTRDSDGTLVYTASPGVANHATVQRQDDSTETVFYTSGEDITSVPDGCEVSGEDEIATCPAAPAARLELGDGDDTGGVSYTVTIPVTVDGGPGSDQITANGTGPTALNGDDGDDVINGGDGKDVLHGGAGDDELDGNAGSDQLYGDDGDDTLSPDGEESPSPDYVDGGAGFDKIENDWVDRHTGDKPHVNVTLAGGADDGRPGEGDDIEHVEGILTYQGSTLVGTDADENLSAYYTTDSSTISGGGGNDTLQGGGGSDTLDGGPGDDTVDGGFGDDTIIGGPGKDRIYGDKAGGDCGPVYCTDAYGDDTIDSRDGEVDHVTCGAGTDVVHADTIDVVDPDCETVDRSAAPVPGTTPGTPGGSGTGGRVTLLVTGHPRLRKVLAHGLKVVVGDPTVKVTARYKGRKVGAGKGSGTVTVRFTRAGRRALRHRRRASLTLAAGSSRLKVTLRR